jgi:glucan phosphoethanolaminetransferase (alkaline phosphatase superfamily)
LSERPRAALRWAARLAFAAQFVAFDVALCGPAAYARDATRVGCAVASALVWGALAGVRRWASRVALALFAAAVMVGEAYFARVYHVTVDAQVVAAARHGWGYVAPVVVRMLPSATALVLAVAAVELSLLWIGGGRAGRRGAARQAEARTRSALGTRAHLAAAASSAALVIALAPPRSATPDLELARALLALRGSREAAAASTQQVPPLLSTRAELPSVLLVVGESTRVVDYGTGSGTPLATTPAIDALLPDRAVLREVRALASYTALSLSALLTGTPPTGPRAGILATPSIYDFLFAVRESMRRAGPPLARGFWTAHARDVLEGRDLTQAGATVVTLETLVGHDVEEDGPEVDMPVDGMLADRFERDVARVSGPLFAVVQLAGTHAPYYVDEAHTPFRPWRRDASWSTLEALHNAYLDAIVVQDLAVARVVRAFVEGRRGAPWMVLFTSDHGEAFGEHQAIHHGQNLMEEQVHVPGWVASAGLFDGAARAELDAWRGRPVTHLDVLPTILDAYGVLDGPTADELRQRLPGRSLLRAPLPMPSPVPMSNCTSLFPCPLDTWGAMRDARQVEARVWDAEFRCWALDDGARLVDDARADPACAELSAAAVRTFGRAPFDKPR